MNFVLVPVLTLSQVLQWLPDACYMYLNFSLFFINMSSVNVFLYE